MGEMDKVDQELIYGRLNTDFLREPLEGENTINTYYNMIRKCCEFNTQIQAIKFVMEEEESPRRLNELKKLKKVITAELAEYVKRMDRSWGRGR